jgi:CDP-diacylglycerol--serine O-phosphatidyltransferase
MYEWAFRDLGKWGWFAAFIYCASAALRLARFNTNIDVVDKRYFQGLPSPAAAALVAGFVWVMLDNRFTGFELRWYAAALTVFSGLSMVSSLKYYSFKSINMRKSVPFIVIFLFALFFILVSVDPPLHLFLLFFGYCLSGYVMWLLSFRKPKAPPAQG